MAAVCALFVGYAALSQYGYSDPSAKGLGAALSVAPIVLIGVILVWRWVNALAAVLVAGGLSAAAGRRVAPAVASRPAPRVAQRRGR